MASYVEKWRQRRTAGYKVPTRWSRLVDNGLIPVRRYRFEHTVPKGQWQVEIGSGVHPRKGYFHIDISRKAEHLEALASCWELPVPDEAAREVRAIHVLEHVEAPRLLPTLREWFRILAPGGEVHISVPNGPRIMDAFNHAPVEDKWALMAGLLGMYCWPADPQSRTPEGLTERSDHQLILDFPLMESVLTEAGFVNIRDRSEVEPDRHSNGWRELVEHLSLIVRANKP